MTAPGMDPPHLALIQPWAGPFGGRVSLRASLKPEGVVHLCWSLFPTNLSPPPPGASLTNTLVDLFGIAPPSSGLRSCLRTWRPRASCRRPTTPPSPPPAAVPATRTPPRRRHREAGGGSPCFPALCDFPTPPPPRPPMLAPAAPHRVIFGVLRLSHFAVLVFRFINQNPTFMSHPHPSTPLVPKWLICFIGLQSELMDGGVVISVPPPPEVDFLLKAAFEKNDLACVHSPN